MSDGNYTEYVVGFLCNKDRDIVVLIDKHRPTWQKGKINGVGGHIEPGETPVAAMQREFREEAGLDVGDWELAVEMTGGTWKVYFFVATGPAMNAMTQTDEEVVIAWIGMLPPRVLPNLHWLIPLCLDLDIEKPVCVRDTTKQPQ